MPTGGDKSILAKKFPQKPNLQFLPKNPTIKLPTRKIKNRDITYSPLPISAFDTPRHDAAALYLPTDPRVLAEFLLLD